MATIDRLATVPRRRGLAPRLAMAAGLLAGCLIASDARAGEAPPRRPNILVVVSDDQGWRDIGYHGSEVRTPNLDRLAAAGVRLENHYVFPTCSPTRAGLLTGRNPSRYGILGPIGGRSELALPTDTVTLADLLRAAGYTTAICGKWHLGLRPQVGPRQYGFESSYGYLHGQIDPYTHLYKNGDVTWHRQDQFLEEPGHATDLLADEAIRFLESREAGPFFLYVAFSVPHTPLQEEARWTSPYDGRIKEPSRALVAASITHMDDAIGRIVEAVGRSGRLEDTLILFTSDNGGPRGSDRPSDEYGGKFAPTPVLADNRPLRGWKGELYEGGIRVPAFVHWAGTLSPRVVTEPLSVLDWLPTIARLVGRDLPAEMLVEGRDIGPALEGRGSPTPRTLYWTTDRQSAVRVGPWKLIETRGEKPRAELFNLADDPNEEADLAAKQPQRVQALREALRQQQASDPKPG